MTWSRLARLVWRISASTGKGAWSRCRWLTFVGLTICSSGLALGGGGPQNVALVVNPNDPDSLAVANTYVNLREIPGDNVIYLPWKPDVRTATGSQFRDKMIAPLLAELDRRQLTPQIDCVAFSSGYPYMVDFRPDFAGQQFAPQGTPALSLNSALYLYQDILDNQPSAFSLDSNAYFARPLGGRTTSKAFSSQVGWMDGLSAAAGGRRYLLSTALGVTYGRGNTAAEIIAYLQRAKAADGTRPKGTIYYMQNNDIRSKVRHETYPAAVAELKSLGVNAEIVSGTAPAGQRDVAGLTTGTSHLRLRAANCGFLPGALVDNLTSSAGQLLILPPRITNPQIPISEFLRIGATGASGTVVEPLAIPAKFPSAYLHVHYVRGLSLAEAFYRSIEGPFQLLILGDPLCQPWAVFPKVAVAGLPVDNLSGTVELRPTAIYLDKRSARRFELYVDGHLMQKVDAGKALSFDTTSIADGWHRLQVVAIDDTPIATQGTWSGECLVKNGRDAIQLKVGKPRIGVADSLDIEVASTADDEAVVIHNGRRLGTVAGGRGRLQVDGVLLGRGTVTLIAVQEKGGKAIVRSRPVQVEIN